MQSQFLDVKDGMADWPPKIPTDHRVMYFERDRATFGFMSHFHPAPIELDGHCWPTAEHFYQAQKSFVHAYRVAIMQAPTPGKAKRLAANPNASGRRAKHSWFRKHNEWPRPDWMSAKLQIMRRADFAKFTQHSELAERLLETNDAKLIEDSPHDAYWGIGHDGMGENWAGWVLMEIREVLRQGSDRVAAHALQLTVATTVPAE